MVNSENMTKYKYLKQEMSLKINFQTYVLWLLYPRKDADLPSAKRRKIHVSQRKEWSYK